MTLTESRLATQNESQMAVPQITIRLRPRVKEEFDVYAREIGLSVSELVKLLIVREKILRRLQTSRHPKLDRQERGEPQDKITAHVASTTQVEEFKAYAHACALDHKAVGAWLIEKELSERWLEIALRIRRPRRRRERG